MKSTNLFLKLFAALAIFSLVSCEKDDPKDGEDDVKQKYIVAATSGENDYLVTGNAIAADSNYDATSALALQAVGDRTWTFYGDEVVYGFVYNQTEAGLTASYILKSDGTIERRNEISLEVGIQTRGIVDDKLVIAYTDRLRDTTVAQKGYFYEVDPVTDASTLYNVVTDDLLEDGEAAYFTDISFYEGYMIAGARSISSSSFTSEYYNNTYVVVFNSDYTVKQVIKDEGRTGFVAGQKYSQGETGLEVVESGDLYVFSSGITNYVDTATMPSGVLKINQGEFDFDDDYFFNITDASGGYNLFRTFYMGGTTFVLKMYPGKDSKASFGVDADRFAVVDVAAKTFNWVTGFPTASGIEDDPFSVGTPFIDKTESVLLVPIVTSDNKNFIYAIDPSTYASTKLSQVIAEGVKAVGILKATEDE